MLHHSGGVLGALVGRLLPLLAPFPFIMQTCSICKEKGVGACIQCRALSCHTAFHPVRRCAGICRTPSLFPLATVSPLAFSLVVPASARTQSLPMLCPLAVCVCVCVSVALLVGVMDLANAWLQRCVVKRQPPFLVDLEQVGALPLFVSGRGGNGDLGVGVGRQLLSCCLALSSPQRVACSLVRAVSVMAQ